MRITSKRPNLFPWLSGVLLFAGVLAGLPGASAQPAEPWYGVELPPGLEPHTAPVIIGERGPVPARVPEGEADFAELRGERLRQDLESIVQFSVDSRSRQEIGSGQLWGRISGFPSSAETVAWAAERFREAGIEDVELQSFDQEADAGMWLPERWEVRLLGHERHGQGSGDVVLESAMALAPSSIEGGELTAPVVYAGHATAAERSEIDVAGKIAVQHVTPQGHTVFERSPAEPRARGLMEAGAVAVINIIDQPGNERARDFNDCGGPCFNLGGRDGHFLVSVMNEAAANGDLDRLRMRLSLESEVHTGLSAQNAVAVIPGRSDETIVLNAHADAWFDGAGDNGGGLAELMALARHFGRDVIELDRTLVLSASAGHHSAGLHGPRNAVEMNPELFTDSVLIVNLEHVAQRNLSPARSAFPDGYRQFIADAAEAPIVAGITNQSPFLRRLFDEGVTRYGVNFVSGESTMSSGEGSGYRDLDAPIVTTMQASPLYHTSGEVTDVVSTPGMERMARFMAHLVKQVDAAERATIDP